MPYLYIDYWRAVSVVDCSSLHCILGNQVFLSLLFAPEKLKDHIFVLDNQFSTRQHYNSQLLQFSSVYYIWSFPVWVSWCWILCGFNWYVPSITCLTFTLILAHICICSQMRNVVIPVRKFVKHIEKKVGDFQIQI